MTDVRERPLTDDGRAGLDALLSDPSAAVVALDFDGTLAPIVDDPDEARALPGAADALTRLARHVGTVAVLTGRPAAVAADYGGFHRVAGLSGLVVLGHYGADRWDADSGTTTLAAAPPEVDRARAALPRLLTAIGAPEAVAVEDKGRSLAVHTRRTTDPDGTLALLRGPVEQLADRLGLRLEPGRRVLELRPPGVDKGAALTAFVAERGGTSVLFAGDDLGDMAAYDAVERLRADGVPGLKVAAASAEVEALAQRADLVVEGPEGVVGLLDDLGDTLDAAGPGS